MKVAVLSAAFLCWIPTANPPEEILGYSIYSRPQSDYSAPHQFLDAVPYDSALRFNAEELREINMDELADALPNYGVTEALCYQHAPPLEGACYILREVGQPFAYSEPTPEACSITCHSAP